MSYLRVIPRDLFNEAKLLKCFGQLALTVLDGMVPDGIGITIEESGEPFQVELQDDGYLCISNYQTFVNGQPVLFKTTYNSKSNYPFYCEHENGDIEVFTEDGKFSTEFMAAFQHSRAE